jgi:hypothetical protein
MFHIPHTELNWKILMGCIWGMIGILFLIGIYLLIREVSEAQKPHHDKRLAGLVMKWVGRLPDVNDTWLRQELADKGLLRVYCLSGGKIQKLTIDDFERVFDDPRSILPVWMVVASDFARWITLGKAYGPCPWLVGDDILMPKDDPDQWRFTIFDHSQRSLKIKGLKQLFYIVMTYNCVSEVAMGELRRVAVTTLDETQRAFRSEEVEGVKTAIEDIYSHLAHKGLLPDDLRWLVIEQEDNPALTA